MPFNAIKIWDKLFVNWPSLSAFQIILQILVSGVVFEKHWIMWNYYCYFYLLFTLRAPGFSSLLETESKKYLKLFKKNVIFKLLR